LLERVRETAVGAFSHGELPFEKVREEVRPKFRVSFELRNPTPSSLKLDDLRVEWVEITEIDPGGVTPFLTLRMFEVDDGLTAWLDYNNGLFEAATITGMLEYFRTLLESIADDPEQHISKLPPPDTRPTPPAQPESWQARFAKRLRHVARRARRAVVRYLRESPGRASRRRGQ